LILNVLDHVFGHYVVECVVGEGKSLRRVKVDEWGMIDEDLGVEPSVEKVVAGPEL
jgi:hypothetical protein